MKKISVLLLGLISTTIMAANQTSTLAPLLNAQEPAQQFVTSDPDTTANAVATTPAQPMMSPAAPDASAVAPVLPPAPVLTPPNPITPAPANTTALGLNVTPPPPENPLAGGLDIPVFLSCKQTAIATCQRSRDVAQFQDCLKIIRIPACKQFLAFAKMTGMAPRDDIDLVKHYNQGQVDLVHLVRFGANYPGVYYAIGNSGDLVDLIFGRQTQGLDIRKDPHYPEIATRFPNTELFSIVDKLPEVQPTPDGTGLRLVFRFQLLNGCHVCERAGYAYVAYDFSDTGTLQSTSILSLEPASQR